jgi:hypothetical protein
MENSHQHRAFGLLVVFASVLALVAIWNLPDENTAVEAAKAHIEDHGKATAARA